MPRATLGKLSMPGFRPLPVPGLITAGSPIPHPGLCCVSRKGQPCPTPLQNAWANSFLVIWWRNKSLWLWCPCIPWRVSTSHVLQRGCGVLLLFYVAGSSHFPSLSPEVLNAHTFLHVCPLGVVVVVQSVWSLSGVSLFTASPEMYIGFFGISLVSHFIRIFENISAILVSSRICGCNLCEFYFFRHVVSPCRVPYGGARWDSLLGAH